MSVDLGNRTDKPGPLASVHDGRKGREWGLSI